MQLFTSKLILVLLLVMCAWSEASDIKVHITRGTHFGFFDKVADGFEKKSGHKIVFIKNPSEVFDLTEILQNVIDGKAEVGIGALAFDKWLEMMQKAGKPVQDPAALAKRVIGHNMLKVIVNEAVGIKELTKEQLEQIFTGKIKNWSVVGGKPGEIKIYLSKVKQSRDFFREVVLNNKEFRPDSQDFDEAKLAAKKVAEDPNGISFGAENQIPKEKAIVFVNTIKIGRPIYMITKGKPSLAVFQLIDYIGEVK